MGMRSARLQAIWLDAAVLSVLYQGLYTMKWFAVFLI
jgi:hypothetical protein